MLLTTYLHRLTGMFSHTKIKMKEETRTTGSAKPCTRRILFVIFVTYIWWLKTKNWSDHLMPKMQCEDQAPMKSKDDIFHLWSLATWCLSHTVSYIPENLCRHKHEQSNSRWFEILNPRSETLKLPEQKVESVLQEIVQVKTFQEDSGNDTLLL
jgi:glutamyl/glutaminyl-tRNA synthetase